MSFINNNNFEYEYMHVSFYSLFYSLPLNFSGIMAIFALFSQQSTIKTIWNMLFQNFVINYINLIQLQIFPQFIHFFFKSLHFLWIFIPRFI